ncbi:MAG: HAD-IIIA family hydrolase [Burkholderiaceae bacterium]|nr:HAD-IIIA family hydrolase [Burkholderiaceae bacterium]
MKGEGPGTDEVVARAARVRLVALDVDGTLTDARLYFGGDGEAMKSFSVRDGFGLTLLREAGVRIAIVTARQSTIVEARATELRIEDVLQAVPDKAQALQALCAQRGIALAECAFVGDDWPDLRAMSIAGLAATVADAPREVRERAHWVSVLPAGCGAVREFAEFVLRAKGAFDAALARYAGMPGRPG